MTTTINTAVQPSDTETVARHVEHLSAYDQHHANRAVRPAQLKRDWEFKKQTSGGNGFFWLELLVMLSLLGGGAALSTVSLWLGFPLFMLGVGVLTMLGR